MSEGPTTEGSIVARLKLDPGTWEEDLDKAGAQADELGAHDPKITITAKVDEALAKIEEVDEAFNKLANDNVKASAKTLSAQKSVQTAIDQVAAATRRLEVAELRGAAAADLYTSAADKDWRVQQRATASLDVRRASQEALTRATLKADLASAAITESESAQERATLKLAAANEVLKLSLQNDAAPPAPKKPSGNGNGGGQGGMMQMMLVAVATLIPMLGPLSGAFAAVSGSIMGMGAAGVLAVLGIKNAMAQGTAAGNEFSGGLHLLKGNLDQLSNTAATAMLVHFENALSVISGYMPSLNAEIGQFAGLLGTTGDIVLGALVSGFKVLLPLFLQAGVYVEHLAAGFKKWTTDGGLAKFAHDAATSLPIVNSALGSLLHGVVSLIGALQPMGIAMLQIITVAGDLVAGITGGLGPAFGVIVAGALAAFGAFQLWGAIAPLIAKVATVVYTVTDSVVALGVASDVAAGPIGWVVAGLGLVAGVALAASAATDAASRSQVDYSAAVQQDNGVIGQNVKAQAAKALADSGALANAKNLGIATSDLTKAALGDLAAKHAVSDALAKQAATYKGTTDTVVAHGTVLKGMTSEQRQAKIAVDLTREALSTQQGAIKLAIAAYNEIALAEGQSTISSKAQLDAVTAVAKGYGETVPQYLAANGAQKAAADQLSATTDLMKAQGDAAGLLKLQLDNLNGKNLTAASTQNAFDQQIAGLTPVTSTTKGGATAAQLAAGQNSVSSATTSHGLAVEALAIAQGNYNTAASKDKLANTAKSAATLAAAHLALGRAQAAVTNSSTAMGTAANGLVATQSKANSTVTSGTSTLEGMTKAAITNRANVISLIASAETATEAYRNQTDEQGKLIHSTSDTSKKLSDMKQQIIDSAAAAGLNAAQVSALVDELFKLPKSIDKINVEVDTDAATAKLDALAKLMAEVTASATTGPMASKFANLDKAAGNPNGVKIPGNADGGTIGGTGGSTQDNQLRRLSVGEEVTRAARAAQYRPLLKAINNGSPSQIAAAAASVATPNVSAGNTFPTQIIVQSDPTQAFADFQRRQNLMVA